MLIKLGVHLKTELLQKPEQSQAFIVDERTAIQYKLIWRQKFGYTILHTSQGV